MSSRIISLSSRFTPYFPGGALLHKIARAFTEHPAKVGENYLQHLWVTLVMSLRFIFVGILLFVHGLLPFLFTRLASSHIEILHQILRARNARHTTAESVKDLSDI